MGFIQGVTAGAAIRDRDRDLYRPTNAALSYGAITDAPRAMGGHNVLRSEPAADLGGMNPAAIHRQAAELVLREKELDLQKTQAQVDLANAQAGAINQKRRSDVLNQPTSGEWLTGRQKQIDEEYQRGAAPAEAERTQIQDNEFKAAMFGAHVGNWEAVKSYVNKYGNPDSRIADIIPSPDNSGEVLIQFEGQDKPAYFANPEALHRGLLFWTSPQSKRVVAGLTGGAAAGTGATGTKQAASEPLEAGKRKEDIMNSLSERWDRDNKDAIGGQLTEDQKASKQKWMNDEYGKIAAAETQGQAAIKMRPAKTEEVSKATAGRKKKAVGTVQFTKDGKKISRTYYADGTVEEGGEGGAQGAGGGLKVMKSGKDKTTGERVVMLSDGTVHPAEDFDYGNVKAGQAELAGEAGPAENPEILEEHLRPGKKTGKGKDTGKAASMNRQAERARQTPEKLKRVGQLMNQGKSAFDAFREVFGDEEEDEEGSKKN